MAAPWAKKPRGGGPRLTLQLTFSNTGSVAAFKEHNEWMKTAFAPEGEPPLKPVELMAKLLILLMHI